MRHAVLPSADGLWLSTLFAPNVLVGELVRKIWNARNFKSHVSPHEFLQAVTNASKKKFKITEQVRPTPCCWLPGPLDDGTKAMFLITIILHRYLVFARYLLVAERSLFFPFLASKRPPQQVEGQQEKHRPQRFQGKWVNGSWSARAPESLVRSEEHSHRILLIHCLCL